MTTTSANTAITESIKPSAQIFQFPVKNTSVFTKNPEEISQRLAEAKTMAIEEPLSFVIPTLFEGIMSLGFKIEDERKAILIIELIRAIMSDHIGVHHKADAFLDDHAEALAEYFDEPSFLPAFVEGNPEPEGQLELF